MNVKISEFQKSTLRSPKTKIVKEKEKNKQKVKKNRKKLGE